MSYLALARKYRPQTFDELVGQEFVSTSLKNAISLNKLSHAYIFTGARGVGKTSAARILAKAINCASPVGSNPCGKCESCEAITNGTSVDVLEIDAGSSGGVDEIRVLRDAVNFLPVHSLKRVYILDEFHMLSSAAGAALLKTLEEPPSHVVFIFATTDVQKVLTTILSRCQRYDFKRVGYEDMKRALETIFEKEKVSCDGGAMNLIIRRSEGCMRDALSLSDQLIAYSEGNITVELAAELLGLREDGLILDIFCAAVREDTSLLDGLIERLARSGVTWQHAAAKLVEHTRNLLFLKAGGENVKRSLTEEELKAYEALQPSEHRLFALFQIFSKLHSDLRYSSAARYDFEFGVYKASSLSKLIPLPIQATDAPKEAQKPQHEPLGLGREEARWLSIIEEFSPISGPLSALYRQGTLTFFDGTKLMVDFPVNLSFAAEQLSTPENAKIFKDFLERKFGKEVLVELSVGGSKKKKSERGA